MLLRPLVAAKGQWPKYPRRINRGSRQAVGLIDTFSGGRFQTDVLKQSLSFIGGGVMDTPYGFPRPDPFNDLFFQWSQAGGNGGLNTCLITPSTPVWGSTTDAYTVSCWLYESQDPGATRGVWNFGVSASWSLALNMNVTTVGKFQARVVTTSGGAAAFSTGETTDTYGAGKWNLVTTVWNPGAGLFLYVNGIQEASNTTATTTLRDVDGFQFYSSADGTTTNGWDGSIADFRVYRRALTAADVWALYDPATRWELYSAPSARVFFSLPTGGGAFLASPGVLVKQAVNRAATY